MYVRAGRPAFARPCVGIHKSTSLMSSSLLLQMSCMSGSPNLNSFRDRGQVAVQLVSCWVLPPGLVEDCTQHSCVIASFFSSRFVSVHVVHPYSSIDVTAAWKKLRFILSVRSDFHIVDSLLIAVHAFVNLVSMSFSVDSTQKRYAYHWPYIYYIYLLQKRKYLLSIYLSFLSLFIWFICRLVGFYGVSTVVDYLTPNSVYMYIHSTMDFWTNTLHSIRMCLTVQVVWQVPHGGCGSCFSMKEWVSLLCLE